MPGRPLVPASFTVPAVLETDRFRLRMLSARDAALDLEAVLESRELLRARFAGSWPREGFTLAENLADLERHEREFLAREAFAYTVVSLDETRVLGCVYIDPARDPEADAEVRLWARASERGLEPLLLEAVEAWLETSWPFRRVAYRGRPPSA